MLSNSKSVLLRGIAPVVFGVAMMSSPATAQAVDPAQDPAATTNPGTGPVESVASQDSSDGNPSGTGGDVIVTGSRLRSPNLESATPITVVSPAEIKQTGTTRVEDVLNSLPQVFASQNSGYANASSGTANVDLRGLGAERNLVLVNGRRLVPGDPTTSAADINVIPGAIIKRVDVLTGGASSVYGADAVAGVVNFVMDTEFTGFRLDGQYSFYNHNNRANDAVLGALQARDFGYPRGQTADGGTVDVTAAFGTSFDDGRGHITAYAGYRKINAVTQDRRDYSACSLSGSAVNNYTCGGSPTSANGTVIAYDKGTSTFFQIGQGRTLQPGFSPYNFAPTNYFQRPDERYTAGFFANYEISDSIKPYAEFMFMDDRTVAQIAPSGAFSGGIFSVNCDNPLLSAQQKGILCDRENLLISPDNSVDVTGATDPYQFLDPVTGQTYTRGFAQILRRNVEGGPRRDDLQHTSYRAVGGVRGDLSPAFSYDAYYQYGRTVFAETYFNEFSIARTLRATDVVTGPNGTPICRSAQLGGSDPNCVPYDIFTQGAVTQEALNYLQVPGFQRGINQEIVINGSVTAQLGQYGIKSPFAEEGLGIVVGGEYRKERLDFFSDIEFQTGDLAGQGAPTLPVAGSFDVKEVFTEVRLPIVNQNFFYDLTATGGYRRSKYNNSGGGSFSTDTYKGELEFAPIRDIRFRAGYNRAVRAPTVQDFFAPNRVALNGSTDPCAENPDGTAKGPLTAADVGCLAQGLSVGQIIAPNPAAQYNGLVGGNAALTPEVADTYTVGVVLQPRWIRNFSVTVDYFKIKLDQAVSTIGQDTTLDICTKTADPFYCSLINRDQFGSLWRSNNGYVIDTNQNIGGLETSGIDVNAGYSTGIGSAGNVALNFVGTYLDKLAIDPGIGDAPAYDCRGYFGNFCGVPNPKWRHQARVSYTSPVGVGASLRWRYIGPVLNGRSITPGTYRLDDVNYFDLSLTAKIADNYNFRFGANNLLDKQPPLTTATNCPAGPCNGNTWPGVYDAIGRYIYAGVTLDF